MELIFNCNNARKYNNYSNGVFKVISCRTSSKWLPTCRNRRSFFVRNGRLNIKNRVMELKKNIIYIFFIFIHVVLCLDFGFYYHRSRKVRFTVKLFSFIQCFVINSIIFVSFANYGTLLAVLQFFAGVNHCAFVLILTFLNPADTICSLRSDLLLIDSKIIIIFNSYTIEFRTILTTLLFLLLKIIMTFVYCELSVYCIRPLVMSVLYFVQITAFDLPLLMYYFIFRSVHFRLKIITERFTNGDMDIVKCKSVYKSLVIFMDKIKKPFDCMVSIYKWINCTYKCKIYLILISSGSDVPGEQKLVITGQILQNISVGLYLRCFYSCA